MGGLINWVQKRRKHKQKVKRSIKISKGKLVRFGLLEANIRKAFCDKTDFNTTEELCAWKKADGISS